MYSLTIRDYILIAHSLEHPDFGPSRNLHGSTLDLRVTFFSDRLNQKNIVIDITDAKSLLHEIKTELNYTNLDDVDELSGELTTIDFLTKYIYDKIIKLMRERTEGGFSNISRIKVSIHESYEAWASYEADFE